MTINACFMGGKQAGVVGLLTVLAKKVNVLAIVTYDDSLSMISEEFKIPKFESINDKEFIRRLRKSDLLICVHGKEIIPKALIESPKIGSINVHPCLYKYKGSNPIERLLKDGEKRASVGVHWITERVDSGKVICEHFVDINECKTVEEVYNILYPFYALVLSKAIDEIKEK